VGNWWLNMVVAVPLAGLYKLEVFYRHSDNSTERLRLIQNATRYDGR
jgi:hypothetical protein